MRQHQVSGSGSSSFGLGNERGFCYVLLCTLIKPTHAVDVSWLAAPLLLKPSLLGSGTTALCSYLERLGMGSKVGGVPTSPGCLSADTAIAAHVGHWCS